MKLSLKQAGEQRKAESQLFQTSVTDQRATINILKKAEQRLKQFYTPELVELGARESQPGRSVAPKPPTPKGYEKSEGSGGVLQVIAKIISNAEVAEKQFEMDEQKAQDLYAEFVKSTTASIEADREAVAEKTQRVAETEAAKAETEEAQLGNDEALAKHRDMLKAHHLDCDWLLKYFDARQQALAEEMDAIKDAKAVLSGADFGTK